MKICPTCNNMSENNASICPYCGRNIIGINENYHDLKIQQKNKQKFELESSGGKDDNSHLVNKIYGESSMRKKSYKLVGVETRFSTKYSSSFNKNIALFSSLFFLISVSSGILNIKLIISNQKTLIIFLIPILLSIIMFSTVFLKVKIKIKMLMILSLSILYLGISAYLSNIVQFKVIELFLRIENISVISISILAVIIEHRYIKSAIFTFLSFFILYKYFLHLKTFGFTIWQSLLIIKVLFLFTVISLFVLFLIYEFIFLNYETEKVVNRD